MGRCYSLDLRERVANFVSSGSSRRAAAHHFGLSESFAIRLIKHEERTGSPAPVRQGRPPRSGKLAPFESFLTAQLAAEPDITMPALANRLMARHSVKAAPAVLSQLLCRHGFTYKKA